MFVKGDLVKHKLGNGPWMVQREEMIRSWPWSEPEKFIVVLHQVPSFSGQMGVIGRYSPEELVKV